MLLAPAATLTNDGKMCSVYLDLEINTVISKTIDIEGKTDETDHGKRDSLMPTMLLAREVVGKLKDDGWKVTIEQWDVAVEKVVGHASKKGTK